MPTGGVETVVEDDDRAGTCSLGLCTEAGKDINEVDPAAGTL